MELYKKYRPTTLNQMIGNSGTVNSLKNLLERENLPHSILITGPKGCGKTTIGRIIKNELKCSDFDYKELDTAVFRGIDTVREIRKNMSFSPVSSPCRIWLIDECFPKGTLIKTIKGNKQIQNLMPGEEIISLNGVDQLQGICKKRVPINHLIYLKFDDKEIITTKNHLFFTDSGWVKAQDLKNNNFIFYDTSYIMESIYLGKPFIKGVIHETRILLRTLWKGYRQIFSKMGKEKKEILFQRMYNKSSKQKNEKQSIRMGGDAFRISKKESKSINKKSMEKYGRWFEKKNGVSFFKKNETKQSNEQQKEYSKNERNKKNKWDITRIFRDSWRKWMLYSPTKTFSYCFGMGNGSGSENSSFIYCKWEEEGILKFKKNTTKLQNRCSKQKIKDWCGSGWGWAQIEKRYITGSKENKNITKKRLEDSKVYKRGNNEQYFKSIIGDKERSEGFVTMYDLQVKNHPSYFANNIAVHNCHMLGRGGDSSKNEAQNALLKALEDTPEHVYFILCTTNPEMLIAPVKSRCAEFQVQALSDKEMFTLIKNVLKKEKISLSKNVIMAIVKNADGSPRNALQLLETVIGLTDDKEMIELVKSASVEVTAKVNELCQAILKGSKWETVRKILNTMKNEDAETIRRGIIGYAGAVLLNGNEDASLILGWFLYKNTYDSGFPLIAQFCYNVVSEIEPPC